MITALANLRDHLISHLALHIARFIDAWGRVGCDESEEG